MLVPHFFLFALRRRVQRRLMRDNELLTRHSEFDADVKRVAATMMPMRRLDNHPAARDAFEILVELVRFHLDPIRNSRGCVHVSKGCPHRQDHDRWLVLSLERVVPYQSIARFPEGWCIMFPCFLLRRVVPLARQVQVPLLSVRSRQG